MKAQVAPLEGNKVKVSVEVEETEVDTAINETFAKFAKELRVPGFRPGKTPRPVLEARIGKPAVRQQALEDHIPVWYDRAVRDKAVDIINEAEIEVTSGQDDGPLAFDAVVEVRPQLKLVGYESLKVTVPSPVVTEEEIQAQVDRLRSNFAELAPVEREARSGDSVVIDMTATRDGNPVPGMSYTDYSVELGAGNDLPELDEHLPGAKAGDTVNFDAEIGDSPVQVEVVVKQVQEKILPEATDEWASEASEFSSLAELREDVEKRLTESKRMQSAFALRNGTLEGLVALVDEEPPAVLVDVRDPSQRRGARAPAGQPGRAAAALPRSARPHHRRGRRPTARAGGPQREGRPCLASGGGRGRDRTLRIRTRHLHGPPGRTGWGPGGKFQATGRAQRAASRGTLGSKEEQGLRLASRTRRGNRRGGQPGGPGAARTR